MAPAFAGTMRKCGKKLEAQDWMTTLIQLSPEGKRAEIIGSIIGYAPVQEGNAPLIEAMSDRRIRIVSLTITEGGYFIMIRPRAGSTSGIRTFSTTRCISKRHAQFLER